MSEQIDVPQLRDLIEKNGPPLSPMLIFTLLDEVERLRAENERLARAAEAALALADRFTENNILAETIRAAITEALEGS